MCVCVCARTCFLLACVNVHVFVHLKCCIVHISHVSCVVWTYFLFVCCREYYFSEENLRKDLFLRRQVSCVCVCVCVCACLCVCVCVCDLIEFAHRWTLMGLFPLV